MGGTPGAGRSRGVAARVEQHVGFARHVAERVPCAPAAGVAAGAGAVGGPLPYAADDAVNAEILLRLRRTTRSIPTSTTVGGRLAIRPFSSTRPRLEDVDALVDDVIAMGRADHRIGAPSKWSVRTSW